MAYLFKPSVIRYIDPNGKRCPKGTPGATKQVEETTKWYAAGLPGWPKGKKVALATDKRVAQKMLSDLVANAERGIAGLPVTDLARAPLSALIDEFENDMLMGLANKNRSAKKRPSTAQAKLTAQRLRALIEGCRFTTVADLDSAAAVKVTRYLAGRVGTPRKQGGLSAQSGEFFRKAAGRFVWWLSVRKNAPVRPDLLADVPGFDAKRDRVHQRRALTNAELAALLDAARSSPRVEYGLTGEDRYFLYAAAVGTGLRAAEMASLSRSSFSLATDAPTVTISSKRAKNRTAATIPLTAGLARQLGPYLAGKQEDEPIWYGAGTWARDNKGAEILRRDLADAGIPYKIESADGPRYAVFHSLRHTYVSRLAESGVGPKELQVLARHADAQTTLNHYTHTSPAALAAAVSRVHLPLGDDAGGTNPLAGLSRDSLEQCVFGLLSLVGIVLSPSTSSASPDATKPKVDRRSAA